MKNNRNVVWIVILVIVLLVAIAAVVLAAITLAKVSQNNGSRDTNNPATPTTAAPGSDLEWWKSSPIYQVYPRSFQDFDGDGTGDLQGIKSRIPYLNELGIKAIWLSPVYQSPMVDYGYDISNFTNIDPLFGTMADFQALIEEVHKQGKHCIVSYAPPCYTHFVGMYLIMDFVPNHSSDQHYWFQQALLGNAPYKDYYVWRDQPNNWVCDNHEPQLPSSKKDYPSLA